MCEHSGTALPNDGSLRRAPMTLFDGAGCYSWSWSWPSESSAIPRNQCMILTEELSCLSAIRHLNLHPHPFPHPIPRSLCHFATSTRSLNSQHPRKLLRPYNLQPPTSNLQPSTFKISAQRAKTWVLVSDQNPAVTVVLNLRATSFRYIIEGVLYRQGSDNGETLVGCCVGARVDRGPGRRAIRREC